MYGYFKPIKCHFTEDELDFFMKTYCGQCGYLQKNFGYFWRSTVSYDSTFFSLLIHTQQKIIDKNEKVFCATAPVKKIAFDINSTAQIFSANISILLLEAILLDKIMEKETWFLSKTYSSFQKQFDKAKKSLQEIGFESDSISTAIQKQDHLESKNKILIEELTEPTATLLARIFSFTAITTNNKTNITPLKNIGYNLGKIIYISDACVDVLEDYKFKKFNPILESANNSIDNVEYFQKMIFNIIHNSWIEIEYNLEQLSFFRHKTMIKNMILNLKKNIIKQVKEDYSSIENKETSFYFKEYLPHVTIVSALFLISPTVAEANNFSSMPSISCASECGEECGECCGCCGSCCGDCCGGCFGGISDCFKGFCTGCKG